MTKRATVISKKNPFRSCVNDGLYIDEAGSRNSEGGPMKLTLEVLEYLYLGEIGTRAP